MSSRNSKLSYAVQLSVAELVRTSDRPTFWTFTFAENVIDKKEAERCYRRLRERVLRRYETLRGVGVWQRQRRGAWHLHMVFDRWMDINLVRPLAQACGFGCMINVKAIGEAPGFHQGWNPQRVANYLSRYIVRDVDDGDEDLHLRPVVYLGGCRKATVGFGWAVGISRLWRLGRAAWSELFALDEGQPSFDAYWFIVRLGWETLTPDEQLEARLQSDAVSRWWSPDCYPF